MNNEEFANSYLFVAYHLNELGHAQTNGQLSKGIRKLKELLTDLQFQQALDQFVPLDRAMSAIDKGITNNLLLANQPATNVSGTLNAVQTALYAEASRRKLAIVSPSETSSALRPILDKAKNTLYRTLIEETIKCLENGSHRSAIVMAWSAAIEQIRRDVLSNPEKLTKFNEVLTNSNADEIKEYEDFYELLDWKLLDTGRQAKVIDKHLHKTLDAFRKRRNHFGHPTMETATLPMAEAFVDTLRTTVFEKLPLP